jgi:hypothetical protein
VWAKNFSGALNRKWFGVGHTIRNRSPSGKLRNPSFILLVVDGEDDMLKNTRGHVGCMIAWQLRGLLIQWRQLHEQAV